MSTSRFLAATLVLLVALVAVSSQGQAHANGVPQLVKLTYLEGVSNWGPRDAEGVLEFSFAEAYARVDVKRLTPSEGISYEGWLTGPSGSPLFIGKLTMQSSGIGILDTRLTDLKKYDYNTFVIAARGPGAHSGEMPPQRSIAGRFTVLVDTPAGVSSTDVRPSELPNTGELQSSPAAPRLIRVGFTMLAAASLALVFIRTRKRRDSS